MDLLLFSDDTLRRGIRELTAMVEIKDKTGGTATCWAYCFCTSCAKQVADSGGQNPQVLSARDSSSSLATPTETLYQAQC